MLNKKFKKAISAVTMFSTVIALSGVSLLAPLAASADTSIVDGDVIKSNATNSDGTPTLGSLDVYIVKVVGNKTYKRLVLNPQVFASYGHLKWSNIKTVSQAVEDSYTTSNLVRVDGDSKVYALTPAGDTGAKSWVNVTATQFLTDAASDPDSIYTINSVDGGNYASRADITTVAQLKAFYKDGTLPAGVTSGDLNVSLSAATPESMAIPKGSLVDFADYKLVAGSTAVSVSSVTVTASGLGADADFTNISLYVDGAKVGTSKTSINSNRQATFNFSNPIVISANSSKTLSIKATVNGTSSYVLGIKSASDIITGGSIGGSFPIYGNTMSAIQNNSIGNITLGSVDKTPAPDTSFGTDNVLLAQFNLTANNEAVLMQSLRMKNAGNNVDGIMDNLKLDINGDEVATGSYDASTGYVTFNLDNNYEIKKSGTATVEVYGDMGTSNVGNKVNLYLKSIDDITFVGETYGFGVQLTSASFANLDEASDGILVTLATGDVTIDMDKAATPDKDVKKGTDGVVLATFSVTSNGENATINSIGTGADFQLQGTGLTDDDFTNLVMVDTATGATYDLAAGTKTATAWNLSTDEEIPLVKGVKKTFQIKADLADDIANGATAKVYIAATGISITGDESDSTISDITPSTLTSATATVKAASLDFNTSKLTAKSVVPSASDVIVYQASLTAGTVDDVKLSSVALSKIDGGDAFKNSNISALDLYLDGKLIKSTSNKIASDTSITFSSFTTDNVIKAGATVDLKVVAKFSSSFTGTGFALEAGSVIAKDASDNSSITVTPVAVTGGSRAITVSNQGKLKAEIVTTDSNVANSVLLAGTANASGKYLGQVKFTTQNEKVKVTELALTNSTATGHATSSDIVEVQLVDASGAVVASKIAAANGSVDFTNLSLVLPADQATSYYIAVKAKGMNVDGDATSTATQNAAAIYHIGDVTANGVDSGIDIPMAVDGGDTFDFGEFSADGVTTDTTVISGAVLNSVTSALANGTLVGGNQIIGKYTLAFENGSNRTAANEELKAKLNTLAVKATLGGATIGNIKVYIEGHDTNTATGTLADGVITFADLSTLADSGKVDGAVTLVITADVTTAATTDYVQTSIANANTDIKYFGDGVSTAVANNYLATSTVTGGTLSR